MVNVEEEEKTFVKETTSKHTTTRRIWFQK